MVGNEFQVGDVVRVRQEHRAIVSVPRNFNMDEIPVAIVEKITGYPNHVSSGWAVYIDKVRSCGFWFENIELVCGPW